MLRDVQIRWVEEILRNSVARVHRFEEPRLENIDSRLVLGSPRTFLSYADSNCGSGECFALHVFTTGVERYGRKRHLKTYAVGRSFGAPFSLSRRIMSSTDVVDAM